MKKLLVGLTVLMTLSMPVQSNTIAGIGAMKCKEYVKEKNEEIKTYTTIWLQGFLTGMNIARVNKNLESYVIPEANELIAMMDLYCIRNKENAIFLGAAVMYFELPKKK